VCRHGDTTHPDALTVGEQRALRQVLSAVDSRLTDIAATGMVPDLVLLQRPVPSAPAAAVSDGGSGSDRQSPDHAEGSGVDIVVTQAAGEAVVEEYPGQQFQTLHDSFCGALGACLSFSPFACLFPLEPKNLTVEKNMCAVSNLRLRQLPIAELLSTERTYVQRLRLLFEVYFRGVTESRQRLHLGQDTLGHLFPSDLEIVFLFSEEFLRDLEDALSGDAFQCCAEFFEHRVRACLLVSRVVVLFVLTVVGWSGGRSEDLCGILHTAAGGVVCPAPVQHTGSLCLLL
jgi:hypothetical protein